MIDYGILMWDNDFLLVEEIKGDPLDG